MNSFFHPHKRARPPPSFHNNHTPLTSLNLVSALRHRTKTSWIKNPHIIHLHVSVTLERLGRVEVINNNSGGVSLALLLRSTTLFLFGNDIPHTHVFELQLMKMITVRHKAFAFAAVYLTVSYASGSARGQHSGGGSPQTVRVRYITTWEV